jgi:hypothetical protein
MWKGKNIFWLSRSLDVCTLFAAFSNLVITPAQIKYLIFYILMAAAPAHGCDAFPRWLSIQKLLYFKPSQSHSQSSPWFNSRWRMGPMPKISLINGEYLVGDV